MPKSKHSPEFRAKVSQEYLDGIGSIQFLVANKDSENVSIICKQLYDLAMLAHKPLSPEEMTAFVKRSNDIMMLLTK